MFVTITSGMSYKGFILHFLFVLVIKYDRTAEMKSFFNDFLIITGVIFITMSHLPGVLFFWKDPERPIDMILLKSDQSKSFVFRPRYSDNIIKGDPFDWNS
ncbi:hypothetical protein J3Q64DRAFT_1819129 [Phycomyces blakesleeanus]|uniref:Uncharacterized protein n=1 Tax=Phycomyces blakesleeanus TaxID=4837 RepID=A0ABR3B5Q9_PHYBL